MAPPSASRPTADPPSEIVFTALGGRALAARLIGGRVEDLLIGPDPGAGTPQPGEIWAARVDRLLAARAAARPGAFLDAGGARLFLIDGRGLAPGDRRRVRVLRAADPAAGKAATATTKIELPGRWLTLTPGAPGVNVSRKIADPAERARLAAAATAGLAAAGQAMKTGAAAGEIGAVLRSRAASAETEAVTAEAQALGRQWADLAALPLSPPRRLRGGPSLAGQAAQRWGDAADAAAAQSGPTDPRVAAALGEALGARVALGAAGDGAWMAVTRAPAAALIDVNAGGARSAAAVNQAAAAEIPRQLRLRGWSGAVLVDFVGADMAERPRLERQLRARADAALECLGWGPLGLLEARRRDDRLPVESVFALDPAGEPIARAVQAR